MDEIIEVNELDSKEISHRAVSGVVVLTARKLVLRIFSYLGSIFLARLLAPEIFGIFAIVSFVINFFAFFSDIGLGAALIQKKDPLTKKDLAVTFTLQQALVLLILFIIYLISPTIAYKYQLDSQGVWLLRVFSISLFLTSLKTIPSILLERKLQFSKLVIPEVVEVVAFQVIAVVLAFYGFGAWSFIIALLVRSFLGLITLFVISPWKPSFAWDRKIAKSLVSFGLPFQLNGFIATIKDAVMPIFVGAVSGATAVGYLNWAMTFSKLPIIFMSDIFRVTFPTYSRIQGNKELLVKAISMTIRFTNMVLFPAVFILAALGKPIIHHIFTDKWLPALPAFYIHLMGILVVGIANTFMDTFWALGKTKIAVKLLVIYTLVNWGASVPLVYIYGFNGAMIGSVIVLYISLPLTWYYMNQIAKIPVFTLIKHSLFAALIAGLITLRLNYLVSGLTTLFLVAFVGGLSYLVMLFILQPRQILADYRWFLGKLKK